MAIEVYNLNVLDNLERDALERKLRAFELAVTDEAARILIRTQAGKDVEGNAFAPYSEGYAARRKAAGRQTDHVDLLFTGAMHNALQTTTRRTAAGAVATIGFSSPRESLKAAGNQRLRRFFGLAQEQVERIIAKMNDAT